MKKFVAIVWLMVAFGCTVEEQVQFADGTQTQLSHWDDRFLIINYWAEWCAPCRHEIPELNDLHINRVSNGIVVLGVNYDGLTQPKLGDVIDRMDIQFPVLVQDPQQKYGYPRAEHLPMTVVINPAREVHDVLVGPQTADSILAALN
jgi:thiol-disulfide isomerase/thioredoxin